MIPSIIFAEASRAEKEREKKRRGKA